MNSWTEEIYTAIGRALLVLAMCSACGPAMAHVRSESFSQWRFQDHRLEVQFTVSEREVTRIAAAEGTPTGLAPSFLEYLSTRLSLDAGTAECVPLESMHLIRSQPGYQRAEAIWNCDQLPNGIRVDAFFDLAAEHTHFAALQTTERREQRLFTGESRSWKWRVSDQGPGLVADEQKSAQSGFLAYVKLGTHHIIGGLDHIVFLLAILLVCRRFSDIAWAVTGFTLGHSLTLALTVLGWVEPRTAAVEAVIGLSIALPALERGMVTLQPHAARTVCLVALLFLMLPFVLAGGGELGSQLLIGLALFSLCYLLAARELPDSGLYRVAITTLFGLVHGFGFAGAFIDSHSGLTIQPWMLAAFNIGVELGQLAIISIVLMVVMLLRRWSDLRQRGADGLAALILAMGSFWFFSRGL